MIKLELGKRPLAEELSEAASTRGKLHRFAKAVHAQEYAPEMGEILAATLEALKDNGLAVEKKGGFFLPGMLESEDGDKLRRIEHAVKHLIAEKLSRGFEGSPQIFVGLLLARTRQNNPGPSRRDLISRHRLLQADIARKFHDFISASSSGGLDRLLQAVNDLIPTQHDNRGEQFAHHRVVNGALGHIRTEIKNAKTMLRK